MNLPDTLSLPLHIPIVFGLTLIVTLILFYRVLKTSSIASDKANMIMGVIILWGILQSVLAGTNFYSKETMTTPPRFLLVVAPVFVAMIIVFVTKQGRNYVDSLSLEAITWVSVIRVPVEICLYWLFVTEVIPELMTFSGRNFDILAGLTAPFVAYFGFQKGQISNRGILIWNYLSLALLLFIVFNALLSAPTVLQQFAFNQPNIALVYFPYVLLPGIIAPIVMFGHFISIRQLHKQI